MNNLPSTEAADASVRTAPLDATMSRLTIRLAAFALGTWLLLPPLLWAAVVTLMEPSLTVRAMEGWSGVAWVSLASAAVAFALWVGVLRSPMQRLRQTEHHVRVLDKRDPLTGLPNREGLLLALRRSLQRWQGTSRQVGVLLIDVDRFHAVNNAFGASAGDQLLRSVASRVRTVVRSSDVVARLGGDRFAVKVEGVSGIQALQVMARNLLRALEPAHMIHGHPVVATTSVGAAVGPEHADNADTLLQCAEVAARVVKARGGAGFSSFEPAMLADEQSRIDLEQRLRRALQGNEFALAFQPIMDGRGERIVAVEALMRWTDPTHGPVSPAAFIPVLERSGMIVDAGAWVLREACRQALSWIVGGTSSLVLSVNVSPSQFGDKRFLQTLEAVLAETGFPASRLQLEVTEGLLLEPTPETLHKIGAIVGLGVRLAVDDFGMGYSSLAYLKTFPLHTLKIDRLFVHDMASSERDAAIVRAIIDLGHGLGLKITAEGVETEEQRDALRTLGCDSLQGFLFSRPVGADAFRALLERPGAVAASQARPANWSPTMAGILGAG